MTESGVQWVAVQSVLATTEPIPAYGGIAIARVALESMAESLNSGSVPMSANHDSRMAVRTRNVTASVRERAAGGHELFMSFEVHPEDWEKYGHLPGMSHTVLEPIRGEATRGKVVLAKFSADAAWFDDDVIIAASAATQAAFEVNDLVDNPGVMPGRVYQFSIIPDARVIIETSLALFNALGPNLAASAIWDGLKLLFVRRRAPKGADINSSTTVEIKLENGDRSINACVTTSDHAVAKAAVDALQEAVSKFTFDDADSILIDWRSDSAGDGGEWKRIH